MYCFRHLASFTRNLWLSTQVMNVYMWWLESSWICHSFYFLSDITDVCPRSWHKTRSQLFLLIPSFQHKMRSVEKWHLFVFFRYLFFCLSLFPKNTVLFIWQKCTSDTRLKSFTFNISCCSHHTSSNKWPVAIFRNSLISKSL